MIKDFFQKLAMRNITDEEFKQFLLSVGYRMDHGTKHAKFSPPQYFDESLGMVQNPGGSTDRDMLTLTVNRSKGFIPRSELSDGVRKIKRLYDLYKDRYKNTVERYPEIYTQDLFKKIKLNFVDETLLDRIDYEVYGHPKRSKKNVNKDEVKSDTTPIHVEELPIPESTLDRITNYKNTLPFYAVFIKKNEEEYRELSEIKDNILPRFEENYKNLLECTKDFEQNLKKEINLSSLKSIEEEHRFLAKRLNKILNDREELRGSLTEVSEKISLIENEVFKEMKEKKFSSFNEALSFVNEELEKGLQLPLINSHEMLNQLVEGLEILEITNEMSSNIEDNSKLIELLESLNITPTKLNIINVAGTISNMISEGSLLIDGVSGIINVGSFIKKATLIRMFKISKIYFNLIRN